jgi:uncharacterized membrane protein YbjE (DUF340 family)
VEFDPFLYFALAGGYALGRAVDLRGPWLDRSTIVTVALLIFFLGGILAPIPPGVLVDVIPLSLLLAALVLGLSLGLVYLLPRSKPTHLPTEHPRPWVGLLFLAPLGAGFAAGHVLVLPYDALVTYALYALLVLIGLGLTLSRSGLRTLATPLVAAGAGAILAALLFSALTAEPLATALASSLGFGWYSLAGPLVATRLGATAGFLAFLSNFLRENLTMVTAPVVGPRAGPEAITAMGGATTMDTTLYFVKRYGGEEGASLALASGFLLTVAASVLVPLVLALL